MNSCPICGASKRQRVIVTRFEGKGRGHIYCSPCGGSYDSDAAHLLSLPSLEGLDFRTAYVEAPRIAAPEGSIYADFEWTDQAALESAIVAPAIVAVRCHGSKSTQRILDVGCGNGFSTKLLADEFGEVVGLDPSPQNPGVQGTLETVRFPDEHFDAVVIVGNLMLHRNIPATMREVHRILVPGGIVYFDFKNIRSAARIVARKLSRVWQGRAVKRNFANMRYGLHKGHIARFSTGFTVTSVQSAPPRLLDQANKSRWQSGLMGTVWRALDRIDSLRDERAWIRVTMRKT